MRAIPSSFLLAAVVWALPAPSHAQLACSPPEGGADRPSPYDSVSVSIGGGMAKVCYGRPSARDRTMIGGEHVPYGVFWRTGANEPTTLHVDFAAEIAGVAVPPGSYSLYTRPGEERWEVFVNRATERWGVPINDEVRAHDVGSGTVPAERLDNHVETFTIRFEPAGADAANMVLEWEHARVRVPLRRAEG